MRPSRPALPALRHTVALAALATLAGPAPAVDFIWSGGNWVNGLTAPDPLVGPDRLLIQAGSTKQFNVGDVLNNQATVLWQADSLFGASGASIQNTGLFDLSDDSATLLWNAGSRPSFVNSGEFRKSAGSLNNVGSWAFQNNGGTLNAQAGAINFNSDANSFSAGSRFIGAGQVLISGNSAFSGSFLADNLQFNSGVITGNAATLAGGVGSAGLLAFSGGDLRGGWLVAAGSTLQGTSGGTKQLNTTLSLVNDGSIRWRTTDTLNMASAATLSNSGLFLAEADATIAWNAGSQGQVVNSSSGVWRAAAGVRFSMGNIAFTNDGGTLDAQADAQLVFNGGSNRFNDGTRFTGAGQNRITGNSRFVGGYTSDNLRLESGVLTGGDGAEGSGTTASGSTLFTGGDLRGNWLFAAGHTLVLDNGGTKQLNVTFDGVNRGTVRWQGTDTLNFASAARLTNEGLIDARASASMVWNAGSQGRFVNAASGTLRASNNAVLSIGGVALDNQGGILEAQAGSQIVYGGGYASFGDGSRFVGGGLNRVSNNASFAGQYSAANLELAAGVITGQAVVATGSTVFSGGDLRGTWTIGADQAWRGLAGGTKQLNVTLDLVNNGQWLWQTSEALNMASAAHVLNQGLFEAQASSSIAWNAGSQGRFDNAAGGTLRAASGVDFSIGGVAFTNQGGTLDAAAGASLVYGGGYASFNDGTRFTGAGVNRVTNNATFSGAYQSANLVLAAGVLTGDGAMAGGTTRWTGGDMRGSWTIGAGQTWLGLAGGTKQTNVTAQVVNEGSLLWQTDEGLMMASGATLTNRGLFDLQADASVQWNAGSQGVLVNAGLLRKSAGTGTSALASVRLSNTADGTIDVATGTIALPTNFGNDGVLTGAGRFVLSGGLVNRGAVQPGNGVGTLTLDGNLLMAASGSLGLELNTVGASDLLLVTGTASLNGLLDISCAGVCAFVDGQRLRVLDASGPLTGSFAGLNQTGFTGGVFVAEYDVALGDVWLRASGNITAAVPEPQTWAMLVLGGLALLGLSRRRA